VNKFEYDIASIIYINCLELSKCPLDIGGLQAYKKQLSTHKERRAMSILANFVKINKNGKM
jgi:hypothetical protein